MTIAGKINALVLVIATVLGSLVTVFTAVREYRAERDQVIERTVVLLSVLPDLQVDIYFRNAAKLDQALGRFLGPYPVTYAVLYDPAGDIISSRSRDDSEIIDLPSFEVLRSNVSATESGDIVTIGTARTSGRSVLAALAQDNKLIQLTLPVFTALNPLVQNLSPADFGAALMQPEIAGSLHVIGYMQVAISIREILMAVLPVVLPTLLFCLLLLLLSSILSLVISRRITAPLSRLAKLADAAAAGKVMNPVPVEGSQEIREITTILNGVISGMSDYKTRMDVDRQLLSMKVEERTSQLTRRNVELNEAVEQVTQTKDRLRQMAYYDSLTELPNRRLFTEQMALLLQLAKRNDDMLALLFLDLDNFKRINDSLGHSAGDLLLREIGSRLVGCVRESDLVAHYVDSGPRIDVSRLGGDEFTVVLNQIEGREAAALVAERLLDALSQPLDIEGHELVVTPSIGIALAPGDASDVDGLLKAADTAMYHAKAAGKNNCLFYNSDMDEAGVERLQLEADLRRALEQNEFSVHYQPQVDTRSGMVVGAEALVRWEHPEEGMIPPFKFIPLMEEMGYIGALGDWVLREACRQVKEFDELGVSLPKVSVNVSALQFSPAFIARVSQVLEEIGLAPGRLELELTEGLVMNNTSETIEALAALKKLGIALSIDDFGTGYSSLNYLSRFPLDELKIDRSFVIGLDKSDNDASLVVAIIAMARSMNLSLVAEGVETHEQYHFLTDHGAHVIQGYLFSKPVSADELKPMLAPWHFMEQIQAIGGKAPAETDQESLRDVSAPRL